MIDRVVGMVGELKGHPALLAIVILQVVTLTMLYFVARELALIEACAPKGQ